MYQLAIANAADFVWLYQPQRLLLQAATVCRSDDDELWLLAGSWW